MSSEKPKIKRITNINDIAEPTDDECVFYLAYNEDMTQITLSISSARPITPEEYMHALIDFVNDASEFPHNLFIEDAIDPDSSLH